MLFVSHLAVLISFSDCVFSVYRNTINYYVLALHCNFTVFVSSINFIIDSLGIFSVYICELSFAIYLYSLNQLVWLQLQHSFE